MITRLSFVGLVVALTIGVSIAGTRVDPGHALIGHWASAHEELMFFASGEFTFQEHGRAGQWKLEGRRLTFGVPRRDTRVAEVLQLTRSRLVWLIAGRKQIYQRVQHG